MFRKETRQRNKMYKNEAKTKHLRFKKELKESKNEPQTIRKDIKAKQAQEVQSWKKDIRDTENRKERKSKKKGFKKFKKLRRRPYVLGTWTAIFVLLVAFFSGFYMNRTAPLSAEEMKAAKFSKSVAEQVMEESIVLLKNEDNLLPLENKRLNVFGGGASKPVFGGGGAGAIDSSSVEDLFYAFDEHGIEYNHTLYNLYGSFMYEDKASTETFTKPGKSMVQKLFPNVIGFIPQKLKEMPADQISDDVLEEAKMYSNTALYVISRTGSEAIDLSVDDVRLYEEEKKTLDLLNENFEHIILLVNSGNAFELGFVDEYEKIDGVLWIGSPGQYGTHAIAKTLTGEITPSGKLVDTYAYDVESNPAVRNTGDFEYVDENGEGTGRYFTNNLENIYIGYRYYETFLDDKTYEETIQFPFGYGLSYTDFEWEVKNSQFDDTNMSVEVQVTNTGDRAGKDVVQVYFTAPYTSGGLEKAAIELSGFAKTNTLAPGESEVVKIDFDTQDMASYDEAIEETWVLDSGVYEIKVARHIRDIVETLPYNVEEKVVYKNDNKTNTEIQNQFKGAAGDLTYLSRANPEETFPKAPGEKELLIPEEVTATAEYKTPDMNGPTPTTGKDYGIQLKDLKGLEYSDPLWDKFVEQFTEEEMIKLVGDGGYWTEPVERLGVPATSMYDGPASIRAFFESWASVAFPINVNAASTWNEALIEEMGVAMGKEAVEYDVDAVYAPSMNMHRSPLGGRNFEYYSEDPYISGKMAAAYTRGIQSTGTVAVFKHFVGNDQEKNRAANGLYVWATEQSLREIYLKPFEIAVKEGEPHGAMSAFNRIGTTWTGGHKELLTNVLREEWGFEGFVITDAGIGPQGNHFNPHQAILAGNDLMLSFPINMDFANRYEKELAEYLETDETSTLVGLQNAVHNLSYYILQTSKVN